MFLCSHYNVLPRWRLALHRPPRNSHGPRRKDKHYHLLPSRVYVVPDIREAPPLAHATCRGQCVLAKNIRQVKGPDIRLPRDFVVCTICMG
jgi:hypothetical protein